jgi:type 1 glutamine amidotransferase
VLVFSRTAKFRHDSIPDGIEAIRRLGVENGFAVDATEDPGIFLSDSLRKYEALIFLSTSGDFLDDAEQAAFEAYIRNGGGFVGIHGAAAGEYDWPFYGELVGAWFDEHPRPQQGTVSILDRAHPSTAHLPARWERFDEWYNYRANPRGHVHVLMTLDEQTYEGGKMGQYHPIAWAHEYKGGRAWYTGLGHTSESFSEPLFLRHLLGGIEWASGAVGAEIQGGGEPGTPEDGAGRFR